MDNFIWIEELLNDDFNWNILHAVINDAGGELNGEVLIPPREERPYNKNYLEDVVPLYTISDFKSHFRMSRMAVHSLCEHIAPLLNQRHLFISLEKKICFFIWLLAKQESYLSASDRFGFGKGTGYYIFQNILGAVMQLRGHFIKWPTEEQRNQISRRIQNKSRLPGVIGAIDGCHILIKQPVGNAIDFYNRKEQHSVVLQAVCNDKMVFTDIFVGMPGKLHDARVFRNSPLYNRLISVPPLLPPEQHIIGDAAYPLMQNLLKPFRDNGHLTPTQHRFNMIFSGQRSVVERSFALLKGRWRRLKFLDMSVAEKVPEVIMAACILHNFILSIDGEDIIFMEENESSQEQQVNAQEDDGNDIEIVRNNNYHVISKTAEQVSVNFYRLQIYSAAYYAVLPAYTVQRTKRS